ncbi:hypothetical protein GE061_010477 [Apolygus lucorum]|uniref:Uncharacterized protein n=1 Tax=Apolygus lucorum TaxID=248454 RepID=A0A8S9XWX4_APOLU|nr:hypothetical protein GE061_010477 [Apolygus lucorum]
MKWKCDKCAGRPEMYTEKDEDQDHDEESEEEEREVSPEPEMATGSMTERAIYEINRKLNKLTSLVGEVKDLKQSIGFMSDQFDMFMVEMSSLKATVVELEKEKNDLKTTVGELQRKVEVLEQNSRNTNVELHGVPESPNEECTEIVRRTAAVLKVNIGPISKAFRTGQASNDRPRKIIATLNTAEERELLVKAAKTDRSLTAHALYNDWKDDRVYINENLTAFRADLLRRVKAKAKSYAQKEID